MGEMKRVDPDELRDKVAGRPPVFFRAADRAVLVRALQPTGPTGGVVVARKKARVLALRCEFAFAVETEHGIMHAEPGDWLVTNHPDDDSTSDVWPVSAARFAATYEVDD